MSNESPISDRELEILRLVATGASNQQIAQQLSISANTVKVHLRNIFGKIGVVSRTEATLYAIRNGLVVMGPGVVVPPDAADEPAEPEALVQPAPVAIVEPPPAIRLEPAPAEAPASPPAAGRRRTALLASGAALAVALVVFLGLRLASPNAAPAPTPAAPSSTGAAQNERWLAHAPLPAPRDGFALTAYELEHRLYVIGGRSGDTVSASVDRYDPDNKLWVSLTDKPTAVSYAGAIVLRGKIYVPGGEGADGSPLTALEIYDPREQRWETGAPMPAPRSRYALVSLEGRLYVIGGSDGQGARAEVFIYDPALDSWSEGPPLVSPREGAAAVAATGRIYVIGGSVGGAPLRESLWLDPTQPEARWGAIAPLPSPVSLPGVVAPVGTILAFDPERHLAFQYDESADAWVSFAVPDTATIASSVALLGPSIYLLGEASAPHPGSMSEYQAVLRVFLPTR